MDKRTKSVVGQRSFSQVVLGQLVDLERVGSLGGQRALSHMHGPLKVRNQ